MIRCDRPSVNLAERHGSRVTRLVRGPKQSARVVSMVELPTWGRARRAHHIGRRRPYLPVRRGQAGGVAAMRLAVGPRRIRLFRPRHQSIGHDVDRVGRSRLIGGRNRRAGGAPVRTQKKALRHQGLGSQHRRESRWLERLIRRVEGKRLSRPSWRRSSRRASRSKRIRIPTQSSLSAASSNRC
jgi:hypothetical protein